MRWPGTTAAAAASRTSCSAPTTSAPPTTWTLWCATHCAKGSYSHIYLVGFSAGGNITLKYLGEAPDQVPPQVKRAAVFSVPWT